MNLTEIIIGDGTETSCLLPFNACLEQPFDGIYSEHIFTEEEMGGISCSINSIAFDVAVEDFMYWAELYIWFGTTSNPVHAAEGDWLDPDEMSLVFYSPDISIGWEQGWATSTFQFPDPYFYQGGNLVIGIGIQNGVGNGYSFIHSSKHQIGSYHRCKPCQHTRRHRFWNAS